MLHPRPEFFTFKRLISRMMIFVSLGIVLLNLNENQLSCSPAKIVAKGKAADAILSCICCLPYLEKRLLIIKTCP